MNKDVQNYILETLAKTNPNAVFDQHHLNDRTLKELSIDSLSLLELIYDLEERFQVTLGSDCLMKLESVEDLVEAVCLESAKVA